MYGNRTDNINPGVETIIGALKPIVLAGSEIISPIRRCKSGMVVLVGDTSMIIGGDQYVRCGDAARVRIGIVIIWVGVRIGWTSPEILGSGAWVINYFSDVATGEVARVPGTGVPFVNEL